MYCSPLGDQTTSPSPRAMSLTLQAASPAPRASAASTGLSGKVGGAHAQSGATPRPSTKANRQDALMPLSPLPACAWQGLRAAEPRAAVLAFPPNDVPCVARLRGTPVPEAAA